MLPSFSHHFCQPTPKKSSIPPFSAPKETYKTVFQGFHLSLGVFSKHRCLVWLAACSTPWWRGIQRRCGSHGRGIGMGTLGSLGVSLCTTQVEMWIRWRVSWKFNIFYDWMLDVSLIRWLKVLRLKIRSMIYWYVTTTFIITDWYLDSPCENHLETGGISTAMVNG